MPTQSRSTDLRREIECRLTSRIPSALSPQAIQAPRLLAISNEPVNSLVGGGLPIGGICEFSGPPSAGRTSLALSALSEATANSACAYVDVSNSFDPRGAAAAGIRLSNLLWVRFSELEEHNQNAIQTNLSKKPIQSSRAHGSTQHHGSRHPRTETRHIDCALEKMFVQKAVTRMKKMEGTPGYPNQMLSLTTASQEQISYDRFNARRADESDPLRQSEHRAADDARERAHIPAVTRKASKHVVRPWDKLDKALRTTDQILQAGGFRVVVLDIASIASEQALRIPLATWYRFNRAAQEGDAILLLVSLAPCAKSIAKCVLYCSPRFTEGESNSVFGNMTHATEVLHQRVAGPNGYKASGKVVEWKSTAHWMRMVGR